MDLSLLSAFLVGATCLAVGYLLGGGDPPNPFSLSSSSFFSSLFFWKKNNNNSTASASASAAAVANDTKKTMLPKMTTKPPLEIEKLAEILEDFKMVLIVRNDLKMGKGKIAAQCSHATLGIYKKLLHRAPKALSRWEMCGQVKVVLKTETEDDLLILQENAKSMNLPTHITIDAGRTQIAPNSRTVMAILGPADLVDDVTGSLKLL